MKKAIPFSAGKRMLSLCALALGLTATFATPVRAEDDPLQLEKSQWISFDHYNESGGGKAKAAPVQAAPTGDPTATSAQIPPTTPAAAKTADKAMPDIAAPARPLDLPPMPGVNKGFTVSVSSTEDASGKASPPPVIAADEPSDIHVPEKDWQRPSTALHYKSSADSLDENADSKPIDVRMTYLPDSRVAPTPTPDHPSAQHEARLTLEKTMAHGKPHAAAKTPAEVAACAAIDAYKKQQLNAIQSDQQTLKALQAAIASLGLQKQLDFMTGSDGSLNASANDAASSTATIDKPEPIAVR